ncbi:MAG: hypothetical protein R6V10_15860 [bacterium]
MEEKKIKGTVFSEYVRMIKNNRSLDWDKYLTEDDWKLVNEMILPSSWYPLESYARMGLAVFKLLAGGDVNAAWNWGRMSLDGLTRVYKNLVSDDPAESMRKFAMIQRSLANFALIEVEKADENTLHIVLKASFGEEEDKAYAYQMGGMLERTAELCAPGEAKVDIIKKTWEGDPNTVFEMKW